MTNFNLNDLYQIVLDRLRKDRKGAINPEEFESFLNNRSIDYYNQQMGVEGVSKLNQESLAPFMEMNDPLQIASTSAEAVYWVDTSSTDIAQLVNVWHSSSNTVFSTVTEVDMLSNPEMPSRLNNAITGPSSTDPVGYVDASKIRVYGVTTGYLLLDYYKHPTPVYFDYYTDDDGNITYLTEGQSAYTLQTGEVARDGTTAGGSVTSISVDLEWGDQDAMNILDMVMTDVGIAQNDQSVVQGSVLERQNNVKS